MKNSLALQPRGAPATDSSAIFQGEEVRGDEFAIHDGPFCAVGLYQGRREEQQDCCAWILESDDREPGKQQLLIVADGMGGHSGGAIASLTVVEAFVAAFRDTVSLAVSERLEAGLEAANRAIERKVRANPDLYSMGSTLVAAHIAEGTRLRWISVGDSPMWRVAGGKTTRLNKDHSMAPVLQQLVELGHLTEAEASADGRRNQLRSAISGAEITLSDLQDDAVELGDDDVLILASDGLETLTEEEIAAVVDAVRRTPTEMAEELLTAVRSKEAPHQDNATVVVYALPSAGEEPVTVRMSSSRAEIAPGNAKRSRMLGLGAAALLAFALVGAWLADRYGWSWVDPDEVVETVSPEPASAIPTGDMSLVDESEVEAIDFEAGGVDPPLGDLTIPSIPQETAPAAQGSGDEQPVVSGEEEEPR